MYHIAVIGAGNIGRRHLQALHSLPFEATLHVVDPAEAARAATLGFLAEQAAQTNAPKRVADHASAQTLPRSLDIAIVATNADVRLEATRSLLQTTAPRFLVLEKVLARSPQELQDLWATVVSYGVPSYVNCSRRLCGGYQALRAELAGRTVTSLAVSGPDWGIGCNAIHFIDAFAFLLNTNDYTLHADPALLTVKPSKRPGFYELHGRVSGVFHAALGSVPFVIDAAPAGKALPITIRATADEVDVLACETTRRWHVRHAETQWAWPPEGPQPFDLLLTSQSTAQFAESLLSYGMCTLPTLAESVLLHRPMLEALLPVFEASLGPQPNGLCPIT